MPKPKLVITSAQVSEHKDICRIAKQSPYTRDFSNMIFSGEDCYTDGRIRVAKEFGDIVGFSCFRHRKRDAVTVLYFLGVEQDKRSRGVGGSLMDDLWDLSTGVIEFKVMKDNRAVGFYRRLGFREIGEAYNGKAWVMRAQK